MENDLVKIGSSAIKDLEKQGIAFPSNYSPTNALAAAYLIISKTVDLNKRPAIDVCSPESIKQSLLTMLVQGLNPIKNQCYFIVYGSNLTLMRSYMGSVALAKMVDPNIKDIRAKLIYNNDEVEIETINGMDIIISHRKSSFMARNKEDIIGAYAIILDKNDGVMRTEIMTMEEIKQSWKQSTQKGVVSESGKINPDKTHGKFTSDMCIRTVINKICKPVINNSNDMTLLSAYNQSGDTGNASTIIQKEIDEYSNKIPIDFLPQTPQTPRLPSYTEMIPIPDLNPNPPSNPATMDQARLITKLSSKLNQKDNMISDISGFIGKKITKLSELMEEEANEYIAVLEDQMRNARSNTNRA